MNFTDSGLLDIYRLELYNRNKNSLTAEDLNEVTAEVGATGATGATGY